MLCYVARQHPWEMVIISSRVLGWQGEDEGRQGVCSRRADQHPRNRHLNKQNGADRCDGVTFGGMARASRRVGRARDQPGFGPLGDCARALGKCLQWVFHFVFSLLSLMQQNDYQGPGFNNVFRFEMSLWNPCQHFPTIQLKHWNNRAWGRWSRDESLCIVLTLVSRTVHVAPESLFLLMRTFPSTALLSRSSLTSCDLCFQYLLGAGFASAAQSWHGETETPFRVGVVCSSPTQSQYVGVCSVCIPPLGMLPCLALCLLSSWSRSWMSGALSTESLECDDAT